MKTEGYPENFSKWQEDLFFEIQECNWIGKENTEKFLTPTTFHPTIFTTDIDSTKKTYHIWKTNSAWVLNQTQEEADPFQ